MPTARATPEQTRAAGTPRRRDPLCTDAAALLGGRRSGHMGRWYYGDPTFEGDKAAGSSLWLRLAEDAGEYTPPDLEEQVVLQFVRSPLAKDILSGVRSACDLGPGGGRAIRSKTFPLLDLADSLSAYTAVDISEEFGAGAAEAVHAKYGVPTTYRKADLFRAGWHAACAPCDLVTTFSLLGNICAPVGAPSGPGLTAWLANIRGALSARGVFIASFSTEEDGQKVMNAYLDPTSQNFNIGVLHRIAAELPVTGTFDPAVWRYRPEWAAAVRQCAHTVYPLRDQTFTIGSRAYRIPAGQALHLSNSYRYTEEQVESCAAAAGFGDVHIVKQGDIRLLVARNNAPAAAKDTSAYLLRK